jgi:hypothetical protein
MNAIPQSPRTSSLAIVSLVAGILGWSLLPLVGTLAAIITGHMARKEIRASAGTLEGDGLAVAGLILGWASAVVWVLGVVVLFLFLGGLAFLASL